MTQDATIPSEQSASGTQPLTYANAGVDYAAIDPFKRLAQAAALKTASMLKQHGATELEWSRGESAYLVELPNGMIMGIVEEGLGTKCLVADAMHAITGKTYYDGIAQDTVAMMVNDLITLGIRPMTVTMHVAAGQSEWFEQEQRAADLVDGWARACITSGASWGCGESPTLKDVVVPGAVVLSGSAMGIARPDAILRHEYIQEGDVIVILHSNGVHANGYSLARKLADRLPNGYATQMSNGEMFGEALLAPTMLYPKTVGDCIATAGGNGRGMHYAVNVTGHGWRKLMRAPLPFEYVIETLPPVQPVFSFMQKEAGLDDREAYSTFNMGAGFALYAPERYADGIISIAKANGISAYVAGHIRKSDKPRVVIKPLDNLVLDSLEIRR